MNYSAKFSKIEAWKEIYRWYTKWEQSLLLPGYDYLLDSKLSEIEEYLSISRINALERCIHAAKDNANEWRKYNPKTTEEINEFYKQSNIYIFDLMWWHSITMGLSPLRRINFLEFAIDQKITKYLDYGCGIGSTGILFAKHGFDVTLADIGFYVLNFAKWRFQKRNLDLQTIHLPCSLPKEKYELISSFDVLEHVKNLREIVYDIYTALMPGGYFIFNFGGEEEEEEKYPQHINHDVHMILEVMYKVGFKLLKIEDEYYYMEK
mgnify:CR=1 FL=1